MRYRWTGFNLPLKLDQEPELLVTGMAVKLNSATEASGDKLGFCNSTVMQVTLGSPWSGTTRWKMKEKTTRYQSFVKMSNIFSGEEAELLLKCNVFYFVDSLELWQHGMWKLKSYIRVISGLGKSIRIASKTMLWEKLRFNGCPFATERDQINCALIKIWENGRRSSVPFIVPS